MRIYDILDLKAGEYRGALMLAHNDEVMKRLLKNAASSALRELLSDPHDFQLMFLGVLDLSTGVIASASPHPVALLAQIVAGPASMGGE